MRLDAFAAGARINPVVHIPDGYLSPVISVGLSVATVPAWAVATQKVKKVLDDRTVPLLAMFSALSFTIMMFNIPVPGGTTAHGVGGTLIAVVLGPWAAVIAVSTALIIQALFFGDGGILAIFANCLNMGVILPVVGYATYRLLAGKSPLLSSRRVWAAGIGSYVGITAAALAVGVELGIQPLLFTDHGHALYSPYGLAEAVPAMLVAHALGASIVEALITALGLAYLQQRHPEYLTSLKAAVRGGAPEEGEPARLPRRTVLAAVGAVVSILAAIGLAEGGGDPRRLFGADWAAVDWPSVAIMLLVTGVIGLVLVPLAYLVLPGRLKRVGAGFATLAVISPLGLIAPGFAYGEGSAHDVQAAFGYVPKGLSDLSALFSAPLAGYEVPLPFLSGANGQLWRAGLGYELAGIVGMLFVGGGALAIARLLADRQAAAPQVAASGAAHPPAVATEARISWLEQTLGGITGSIEHAVFTEEHSRTPAFLQRRDPRAKLAMFLALVLAASLTGSLPVLVGLYTVTLAAAVASRVPLDLFVRRVWLGIPLFAGIVVVPAVFFVPGPRLFDLVLGPIHLAPSMPGVEGAVLFVARVGVSVSLAVLLVMTTPWADILKSLRALRVPQVFVLVLSMTYRYIFLFLHTANGILLARKSRIVARTSGGDNRRFISGTMGNLVSRAFKTSDDVYAAMLARGFTGEMRAYAAYRMRALDWLAMAVAVSLACASVAAGRLVG